MAPGRGRKVPGSRPSDWWGLAPMRRRGITATTGESDKHSRWAARSGVNNTKRADPLILTPNSDTVPRIRHQTQHWRPSFPQKHTKISPLLAGVVRPTRSARVCASTGNRPHSGSLWLEAPCLVTAGSLPSNELKLAVKACLTKLSIPAEDGPGYVRCFLGPKEMRKKTKEKFPSQTSR